MKIKKYSVRDAERKNGRAYFFPVRESIIKNLTQRQTVRAFKKLLLGLLKKKGLQPESIYFSKLAGCQCGCSPGFILKGLHKDIYVDVK